MDREVAGSNPVVPTYRDVAQWQSAKTPIDNLCSEAPKLGGNGIEWFRSDELAGIRVETPATISNEMIREVISMRNL